MELSEASRAAAEEALARINDFELGRHSVRATATALLRVFERDTVLRSLLDENWLGFEELMSEGPELLERRHREDSTIDEHMADTKRELLDALAGQIHKDLPRRRWRHDELGERHAH